MRYINADQVLEVYRRLLEQSGGTSTLGDMRDRGALELAVAQPSLILFEVEKHIGLVSKAVALGYALISLHPFIDGNKRVGHAAMEIMLFINGYEIVADVAEQERVVLAIAASQMSREALEVWLEQHIQPR